MKKKFHLVWDDSCHTMGITAIDNQHRELMNMINVLAEAVVQDCGCELAHQHIAKIIRFAEAHFSYEEELMRHHDFPEREKHAAEHAAILRQAVTMTEALKPGDINRTILVIAYLTDCAENHIMHGDKALALYLQEKGVS